MRNLIVFTAVLAVALLGNLGVANAGSTYDILTRGDNTSTDAYTWYGTGSIFTLNQWLAGIGVSGGTSGDESYRIVGGSIGNWTTRLEIDTDGNVGIGTAPLYKLQVKDSLQANQARIGDLVFSSTADGSNHIQAVDRTSDGTSNGNLFLGAKGQLQLLLDTAGNVGIGTGNTPPAAKLDVVGDILATDDNDDTVVSVVDLSRRIAVLENIINDLPQGLRKIDRDGDGK